MASRKKGQRSKHTSGPQNSDRSPRNKNNASRGDKPSNRGQSSSSSLPRAPASQIWLFGNHPVTAALDNPNRVIHGIAGTANALERYHDQAQNRQVPTLTTTREELDAHFGEGAVHQGIGLLVSRLPEIALEDYLFSAKDDDVLLILDQITDPHNVGAILRSAAVFGAAAVILPERNAPEETAVLAKSASGALESTSLIYIGNLARALEKIRDAGFWTVGFAGESESNLHDTSLKGRIALVMGAEGPGMRRLTRENCDILCRIPMADNVVGSLNVSNAAAIALYATYTQRD